MTRFGELVLIGVLTGTLGLIGCSSDPADGTGGTGGGGGAGGDPGPTCDTTACIICPPEALGPQGGLIGELNTPVDFTAEPQGPVVQGGTVTIEIAATSEITVPVPVEATVDMGSTTTYAAASGGTGELEVAIPVQELSGSELVLNGGTDSGPFEVDPDAEELVIQLDAALIKLTVLSPAELPLEINANNGGGCTIIGPGVIIPVSGAGGAGGEGGAGGQGGGGGIQP